MSPPHSPRPLSSPRREWAANELGSAARPSGVSGEGLALLLLQIAMQVGAERCSGSAGAPRGAVPLY